MYSLTVLEAVSLKSRCWQGRFLLGAQGESLCFASLPASSGSGCPGRSLAGAASLRSLPPSLRGVLSVLLCSVSRFPSSKD